jgi:hypothetical protein
MRKILIGALAVAAVFPAGAQGAEVLGSTGGADICADNQTSTSPSVETGADFVANSAGVITSWSTLAGVGAGYSLKVVVLRRPNPLELDTYAKVAEDIVRPLATPSTLNVVTGTHIPIDAGQFLGVFVPNGQPGGFGYCYNAAGGAGNQYRYAPGDLTVGGPSALFTGGGSVRLNLSAIVEPDADKDGFGDETQDLCPTSPATQGACPVVTTKKKCKKKKRKKGKSAAAAKKKKGCKKKRKKK